MKMPYETWLDDLVSELGEPEFVSKGRGMTAARWIFEDKAGAGRGGLLLARSAAQNATSLLDQVEKLRTAAAAGGLAPRQLVAATGSGTASVAQRPDLALALEAFQESWCTFAAAVTLNRYARSVVTVQLLLDESERNGVELLAMDSGRLRALDGTETEFLLWNAGIDEADRRALSERTRLGRTQRTSNVGA